MKVERKGLLAAVLAAVFTLPAAAEPTIDFDRGVDIKAVMENIHANIPQVRQPLIVPEENKSPGAAFRPGPGGNNGYNGGNNGYDGWSDGYNGGNNGHNGPYNPHPTVTTYYTQSCKTFRFFADSSLVSDRYLLRSREQIETCYTNDQGYRECTTHYVRSFEKSVGMSIQSRQLLPWENESFEICLKGPELRFRTHEAAYSYDMQQQGFDYERTYSLYPQGKIPTDPDQNGMTLQSFTYDPAAKNFKMSVFDKWARYYSGEQTSLRVKLIKNRSFWGDQTILERDIPMEPASVYEIDLSKFADLSNLQPGQYFVQWGFKRIGTVSKPNHVDRGQTNRIAIGK